ncbi:MAG: CooT family nickel-binding protein [Methanothrix sp.]|nr:CooT family nickel-binding protein [Methanothrix sp.]
MCEFIVYLEGRGSKRREVARGVVAARRKDGDVMLMDIVGSVTKVEDATIQEVNTLSRELILV